MLAHGAPGRHAHALVELRDLVEQRYLVERLALPAAARLVIADRAWSSAASGAIWHYRGEVRPAHHAMILDLHVPSLERQRF